MNSSAEAPSVMPLPSKTTGSSVFPLPSAFSVSVVKSTGLFGPAAVLPLQLVVPPPPTTALIVLPNGIILPPGSQLLQVGDPFHLPPAGVTGPFYVMTCRCHVSIFSGWGNISP
ncbi:hypothetical protein F5146DRAFT_1139172 [Armillaria mellea]|nr:hypothetical protein F5146DRAFT_1139172 [Armillaria mellea]